MGGIGSKIVNCVGLFRGDLSFRRSNVIRDTALLNWDYVFDLVAAAMEEGVLAVNHTETISSVSNDNGRIAVEWRDQLTGERYVSSTSVVVKGQSSGLLPRSKKVRAGKNDHSRIQCITRFFLDQVNLDAALFCKDRIQELSLVPFINGVWCEYRGPELLASDKLVASKVNEICSSNGYFWEPITASCIYHIENSKLPQIDPIDFHWTHANGYFTLEGGRLADSRVISQTLLKELRQASSRSFEIHDVSDRTIYRGLISPEERCSLQALFVSRGIPQHISDRVIERHGKRAFALVQEKMSSEVVADSLLFGELLWGIQTTGAVSWHELLCRRLGMFNGNLLSTAAKELLLSELGKFIRNPLPLERGRYKISNAS